MLKIYVFIEGIGSLTLKSFEIIGKFTTFIFLTFAALVSTPFHFNLLLIQVFRIGYASLPVVALTAFFTGAALALQIFEGGSRFSAESVVPSIVAIGMIRELGPVLGGLIVAGRVSASISAEIGTMKVTEQIDALITLSTNPFKFLVVPRVVASVLSMPLLVSIGNIIGILGGYIVATNRLGFGSNIYLKNTIEYLVLDDILSGLIKAATFGFIISSIGCFAGFQSMRGAEGVGRATTNAVVSSSILILSSNYILTELLF